MGIVVRDMRRDDFDGVQAVFRQLHAVHVDARPDWFKQTDSPLTREVFDSWFEEGSLALVAELDVEVVGFCTGYIRRHLDNPLQSEQAYLYVENFATLERVRRRGVGRAMVDEVKTRAKAMGCDRLGITVWGFNHDAYEFYRAMGFTDRTISLEMKI